MRFWRKTQGAVSIFLVIILVPMMTVASTFVDISRVSLAKSVAVSAGDLTLNTALTDYDTMLKDMYGLFATAQDTDELYEKLEDYYRTCITSSGVSVDDAESYVQQIMAQLGTIGAEGTADDVLNMELVDFDVSKKENANLANETVLKKQIVDFMKYRAPINTGLSFISSLESFTTLGKQTDLVDKRKEYYEAEQGVMENLKLAWNEINEYNKSSIIKDDNYFSNMKNNFPGYENRYKEQVNRKTIMDLYDTASYKDYSCVVSNGNQRTEKSADGTESIVYIWKFTYSAVSAGPLRDYTEYYPKSVGGYDSDKLPTVNEIKTLMSNFYENYNAMVANGAEIVAAPSGAYELQCLVQNRREQKLDRYSASAVNVYTIYQKLKNAMIWVEGYDLSTATDEDENTITAQSVKDTTIYVNRSNKKISAFFSDITSKYESAMSGFAGIANQFSNFSGNVNAANLVDFSGVNNTTSSIAAEVNSYIATLEAAATNLEAASGYLETAKTSIESGELNSAKNNWKAAAGAEELKNTPMAKQDQAEIEQLGSYLNKDEIGKMITRLNRVAENLRATSAQIKEYKFDGTFIGDIQNYDMAAPVIAGTVGDYKLKHVPMQETELRSAADGWFQWNSGNVNVDWIDDSGTQVKLHGEGTDKLNFYSYLYTHFNEGAVSDATEEKTEDTTNGKDLYKNIKSKSETVASTEAASAESGSAASANEISAQPNLPSQGAGGAPASAKVVTGDSAAKETSGSLDSMFSSLASAVVDMGTDLRDKLYVSDYILNTFSYDTIEKEYLKEHPGKTVNDITSMTLVPINATNNFAYEREVEYIIYGGNNDANIAKAYGSIYGIRLGFNLIYAFMDSSIRDSAFAIATPISAATLGVIPVPLIQAAIIIGIACCESAIDLNDIKDGESVPLFKSSKTWHCSVKGIINVAKGVAGDAIESVAEYAVDAGVDEISKLLDMTDEELNAYLDAGTDDLTTALGDSYDSMITRHANTVIQKLTTLASNALQEYAMNPAMDKVEYVSNGLDEWLAGEAVGIDVNNDIGYIVKKEAVQIIKQGYISQIIDVLEDAQESVQSNIDNMGVAIMTQIEDIREDILTMVRNGNEKVKSYKTEFIGEIKTSMADGADSLKSTLREKINGAFGSAETNSIDNTGISSLLSFSYSDYLRLFLMIGLYTNESGVLLRTADAIQVNMAKKSGDEGYVLSKSAVYVECEATVQVKPLLLAIPLFVEIEKNPKESVNWYTIEYSNVKGY